MSKNAAKRVALNLFDPCEETYPPFVGALEGAKDALKGEPMQTYIAKTQMDCDTEPETAEWIRGYSEGYNAVRRVFSN